MKDPDRIRRGELRRTDICGVVFLVLTVIAFALDRSWEQIGLLLIATLICLILPRAKELRARFSREGAQISAPLSNPAEFDDDEKAAEPGAKPAGDDVKQPDEGRQSG